MCRTNYDRDKYSRPIVGKYGYNIGSNVGLSYRIWKNWHVNTQTYCLWNISKQKQYIDGPIINLVFGLKYYNDWEEE